MKIFDQLAAPFPPDRVSWRIGSTNGDKTKGLALAYVDARDVMDRLDAVVGPANWQNRYPHANGKTVCEIGINMMPGMFIAGHKDEPPQALPSNWVWKSDGAGDSDVEAEKGALSDAFKRAAVRWGIGRYLYDISSPWVSITQRGRSYVIADSEYPKLEKLLIVQGGKPDASPSLVDFAREAAARGIDSYKDWYLAQSINDRNALAPYHEQLKSDALNASGITGEAAA